MKESCLAVCLIKFSICSELVAIAMRRLASGDSQDLGWSCASHGCARWPGGCRSGSAWLPDGAWRRPPPFSSSAAAQLGAARRHGRPGVTPRLAPGREVGSEDGGGAQPGTLHGILAVGRIRGGRCKVRRRCCSDRRTEAVPGAREPASCHGRSMARSNGRCFSGRRGTLCFQRMAKGGTRFCVLEIVYRYFGT